MADRALAGVLALFGFGGSGGLHPVAPGVAEYINRFLCGEDLAADRALLTLGQTRLGAGRCLGGDDFLGVAGGIDGLLRHGDLAADGALLALGQAGFGTGGCYGRDNGIFVVTGGGNYEISSLYFVGGVRVTVELTAGAQVMGLGAGFGAGGGHGVLGRQVILAEVAQSIHVPGLGFMADRALAGVLALLVFGGRSGLCPVAPGVAGGIDGLLRHGDLAADGALLALGEAGFGAGGCHGGDGLLGVAGGRYLVVGVAVAARAGVGGEAFFRAGGGRDNSAILVGVHFARHIVSRGHGIVGMERSGFIVRAAGMVGEGGGTLEQPAVLRFPGVPGAVRVVVNIAQLHNVPGVVHAIGSAGDDAGIHAGHQQHAVEKGGVALAHGGAVDERGVSRELEGIGLIFQIGVVVGDVGADVVVDGLDLGVVIGLGGEAEGGHHRLQCCRQLSFLLGGGIIGHRKGNIQIIIVIGTGGNAVGAEADLIIVPQEVVALGGHTGMAHGQQSCRQNEGLELGVLCIVIGYIGLVDAPRHGDGGAAGLQTGANGVEHIDVFGEIGAGVEFLFAVSEILGRREALGGRYALIQGIGIRSGDGLPGRSAAGESSHIAMAVFRGKGVGGQQGQHHTKSSQERENSLFHLRLLLLIGIISIVKYLLHQCNKNLAEKGRKQGKESKKRSRACTQLRFCLSGAPQFTRRSFSSCPSTQRWRRHRQRTPQCR